MSRQPFSLEGKVCIVTGAGKGIGRETARLFHEHGAQLALITRSAEDFDSLREELGDDHLYQAGDVGNADTIRDFVAASQKKFSRIDVLVNNAGVRLRKSYMETDEEDWKQVMDINFGATHRFCRHVGGIMLAQKSGSIINMASIIGTAGLPEVVAYGASKGAVITLTKCLATEWAPHGIRVNVIAPGFCETSYAEKFKSNKKELHEFTLERTPMKRWGTSEEVANTCLFLAADASSYITGDVISVDGGWNAW